MTSLRFKPIVLAVALALLAGTGIAMAADNDTSHRYCPRGARLYWGLFGYWCEDGTLNGVHPFDCKSGPGQATGTWNNDGLTPEQLCMQQSSSATQPGTTNP